MTCAVFLLGFKQLQYITGLEKYFLKLKGEQVHLLCQKCTVLSHLGELGNGLGILTRFSTERKLCAILSMMTFALDLWTLKKVSSLAVSYWLWFYKHRPCRSVGVLQWQEHFIVLNALSLHKQPALGKAVAVSFLSSKILYFAWDNFML